ncbi:MAG: hypothetical protein LBQ01_01205 [Prevotellaceae bacterium]|nr:hypothetical protein [Prevotellaceae bacterium]
MPLTKSVIVNIRFVPKLKRFDDACRRVWRRSNPRPIVIARSAATKQSRNPRPSGLLRRALFAMTTGRVKACCKDITKSVIAMSGSDVAIHKYTTFRIASSRAPRNDDRSGKKPVVRILRQASL